MIQKIIYILILCFSLMISGCQLPIFSVIDKPDNNVELIFKYISSDWTRQIIDGPSKTSPPSLTTQFSIEIKNPSVYFKLQNTSDNTIVYATKGSFKVHSTSGNIISLDEKYRFESIVMNPTEIVWYVSNNGEIISKFNDGATPDVKNTFVVSGKIPFYTFSNPEKLKNIADGIYEKTNESGDPVEINIKEK